MNGFKNISVKLGISSGILLLFSLWTSSSLLILASAALLLFSSLMTYFCAMHESSSDETGSFNQWLDNHDTDRKTYFCILAGIKSKGLFSTFFDHSDSDYLYKDIETELKQYFGRSHVRKVQRNLFVIIKEFPRSLSESDEQKMIYQEKLSCNISERLQYLLETYDQSVVPFEDIVLGCATSGIRYRAESMKDLVDLAFFTWKIAQRDKLSYLVANETIRAQKLDIEECKQGFLRSEWEQDFNPFFQPIIDPDSFCIVGMESLARWQLNGFRMLSANIFKDIAGEMHRISNIDEIIIKKTFACAHALKQEGFIPDDFKIVLNISEESITDGFPEALTRLALKYKLPPKCIELDVTDTMIFDPQLRSSLRKLRSNGFRIAMDMFDENEFNLNTFFIADFDIIKLDFNSHNSHFLRVFQSLQENAKELDLEVLAKGIETRESMEAARSLECDYIQGNYFTPPIPIQMLRTYLQKYKSGLYIDEYEETPELA